MKPLYVLQEQSTERFGRALKSFNVRNEDVIQFNEGAVIKDIETDTYWNGWWRGTGPSGKRGFFPSKCVQIVRELQVRKNQHLVFFQKEMLYE